MIATICDRIEAAPKVIEHPRGLTRSSGTSREGLGMKPTRKQDDPCSVQGCTSTQGPKGARGLCKKHYKRMRRTGSPTLGDRPAAEARFLAKVAKVQSGCWLWTAARGSDGYGSFSDPRQVKAHIWAYEHYVGPVPVGLQLDHLCRMRSCVNPAHLEPVTSRENTLRGDTIAARNAAKTHCKHGHEFTLENVYITPRGGRCCRACTQIHIANYRNRKATA